MTRRSGKVLTEEPASCCLTGHQTRGTIGPDRTEAAQARIVLAGPCVALAQPCGLFTHVEEDIVPAVDLANDREGAAPVGKLLDGGIPIR